MPSSLELSKTNCVKLIFSSKYLRRASRFSFDCGCYFSAFVCAARSVTVALQETMSGIPNFNNWYKSAQARLKAYPLAPFFVEIRNDSVHKGNPLTGYYYSPRGSLFT